MAVVKNEVCMRKWLCIKTKKKPKGFHEAEKDLVDGKGNILVMVWQSKRGRKK